MFKYVLVGFFVECGDSDFPYHEEWVLVSVELYSHNNIMDAIRSSDTPKLDEDGELGVAEIMNKVGCEWLYFIQPATISTVQTYFL